MDDAGILYGHLVNFPSIWYILLSFGMFCGHLVHFPVLVHCTTKNLANTLQRRNPRANQGCQMVCFQNKNPNLGKFWKALDWPILIYFTAIWNILGTFDIFYGHLVQVVFVWYIFPVLVHCTTKNLATLEPTTCCNRCFPDRKGRQAQEDLFARGKFPLREKGFAEARMDRGDQQVRQQLLSPPTLQPTSSLSKNKYEKNVLKSSPSRLIRF
jgi:hypothetical protein